MRLLRVELTRFRWRRAIALMLVGAALLTALIAGMTIWETRPVSAADRAAAESAAAAEAASPQFQRQLRQCERNPEQWVGPGTTKADCAQLMPRAEWYLGRSELSLAQVNQDAALAVVMLVVAVMVVAGTTFAGADWASGSMSNQLLFEPRRARIWLAKAGAVLLAAFVASAVLLAAFWVSLYLVAESRGIPTGAADQAEIRWTVLRAAVLAAAGATGAYALTMLLRHTVGTLAVLFGYAVVGQILLNTLPVEGIGRWSLVPNVFGWLADGYEYYDPTLCDASGGGCTATVTLSAAAAFLGILLAVVGALSLWSYTRRDIP